MDTWLTRRWSGEDVVASAETLLRGCSELPLIEHEVPAWRVVNRLAHGELDDLVALTRPRPSEAVASDWAGAFSILAMKILGTCESRAVPLVTLQRTSLVPLELELLAQERSFTPIEAILEIREAISLQRFI